MKNLTIFVTLTLFLTVIISCGPDPIPQSCPYFLELISGSEECDTPITFHFVDEAGNEYSYTWTPGEPLPMIPLTTNTSYDVWITDVGGSNASCGEFEWSLISHDGTECMQLSEYVDERLDIIAEFAPEYEITTSDNCDCPEVIGISEEDPHG